VYGFAGENQDETGLTYLRARYLDNAAGRFISSDALAGVASDPPSFNKWAFVEDAPVTRTDPSGNCWVWPPNNPDADPKWYPNWTDACGPHAPHTANYDVTHLQRYITWDPASDVTLASQIPQNIAEAQYYVIENPPAGRSARGAYGYKLCGPISLSMILEYETSTKYRLLDIIDDLAHPRDVTGGQELFPVMRKLFPRGVGWRGAYYTYAQVYHVDVDADKEWYEFLPTNWYLDAAGTNHYADDLREALRGGHYLMAAVRINIYQPANGAIAPAGAAHWVLITGFSAQWQSSDEYSPWNWVRVNNPFGNRVEYYWWRDFKDSATVGGFFLIDLWKWKRSYPRTQPELN
jgi:RHS repeat-associated protein